MSREKEMRKRVVKALRPLDAMSVENGCGVGTPDVNFADGWIELKVLEDWPANPGTMVRVDLFTKEQRMWHRRRHAAGGKTFVLIKIGRDWLLFLGHTAAEHLGTLTKYGTVLFCHKIWWGHFDDAEFARLMAELCSRKS